MKKTLAVAATAFVLFATSGCMVMKSEYDRVATDLASCQQAAQAKDTALTQKQTDLDACQAQWQEALSSFGGQQAKTEDVVKGLREWKTQLESALPETVKKEVGAKVNEIYRKIETGFGALAADNRRMAEALEKQNVAITNVGSQVTGAREELIKEVAALRTQRDEAGAKVGQVIAFVQEWDQGHVLCKDCDTKLRLNKKEIEAITEVHAKIVQLLSEAK